MGDGSVNSELGAGLVSPQCIANHMRCIFVVLNMCRHAGKWMRQPGVVRW